MNPTELPIPGKCRGIDLALSSILSNRLDADIDSDLVSVGEAIRQRLPLVVNANLDSVERMGLDAQFVDTSAETKNSHGRIVESWRGDTSWQCDIDHMWDLCCQSMPIEGRDQTTRALVDLHGDCY